MSYNFLDRLNIMLEDRQKERLSSFRVIIVGAGGVGGALAHMLVRSGIRNIGIVDFDRIDVTNINRQFVAYQSTVGKYKVDVLENQLKDINPELIINKFNLKLDQDTINNIDIDDYDYVVDCIDDMKAKKLLIKYCYDNEIRILSAMGAGNRYLGLPNFEIADISKTSYDPIAKIIRKFCVEERIKKLKVCYTKQKAIKNNCQKTGSVVYYIVNMSSIMCAEIMNDILSLGE